MGYQHTTAPRLPASVPGAVIGHGITFSQRQATGGASVRLTAAGIVYTIYPVRNRQPAAYAPDMQSQHTPARLLPGVLPDLILPGSAGSARIARDVALVVAGSLLVALFAQIKIPLGFTPVPITGQTFAVLVVGALLGGWRGGLALALYAVEGAFLPFFAGGASGWFWLLSSGGYIVGFIPAAALVGYLCQAGWSRRPWILAAMLLGNAALYVPGLLQLHLFLPADVADAWGCADVWQCGLLPFIPGDLVKLVAASLAVPGGWALLDRFVASGNPPTP